MLASLLRLLIYAGINLFYLFEELVLFLFLISEDYFSFVVGPHKVDLASIPSVCNAASAVLFVVLDYFYVSLYVIDYFKAVSRNLRF